MRAHVSDGKTAAIVVAGKGSAQRVGERLSDAEVPYVIAEPGHRPQPGEVTVFCAPLRAGIVCPDAGLVVVAEADLTAADLTDADLAVVTGVLAEVLREHGPVGATA